MYDTLVIRVYYALRAFHNSREREKDSRRRDAKCWKRHRIFRFNLGPVCDKAIPNDLGRRESDCFTTIGIIDISLLHRIVPHRFVQTLEARNETAADRLHTSQYLRESGLVPERLQVVASVPDAREL